MAVAAIGIVVNTATAVMFYEGREHDLKFPRRWRSMRLFRQAWCWPERWRFGKVGTGSIPSSAWPLWLDPRWHVESFSAIGAHAF